MHKKADTLIKIYCVEKNCKTKRFTTSNRSCIHQSDLKKIFLCL